MFSPQNLGRTMISNILILIILLYLAIRLLALIVLIFRRLNRNRNLTPSEAPGNCIPARFAGFE